jgi:hypothetical protein
MSAATARREAGMGWTSELDLAASRSAGPGQHSTVPCDGPPDEWPDTRC